MQERRLLDTERGRITVGWLVVQDLAMVLLVMLPPLAGVLNGAAEGVQEPVALLQSSALTLGTVAAFILVMLVVGRKLIPALLHYVAHTGSRKLFRLAVLSIALGFADAASELFGVSLALGAFFAGMILIGSRLSQQAATESLAFRDAFAVMFFVLRRHVVQPKYRHGGTGRAVRHDLHHPDRQDNRRLSRRWVSLGQIGEFSFILAELGVTLAALPESARDLILTGAIISILVNPLLMELFDHLPMWRACKKTPSSRGRRRKREAASRSRLRGSPIPSSSSATAASAAW